MHAHDAEMMKLIETDDKLCGIWTKVAIPSSKLVCLARTG